MEETTAIQLQPRACGCVASCTGKVLSTSTKAALLPARMDLRIAVLGNKLYALGGVNGPRMDLNQEYDPSGGTWSTKAPLPSPRTEMAVAVAGGKIYSMGGNDGVRISSVAVYDYVSNEWSARPDMSTARSSAFAAAVKGKIRNRRHERR